MRVGGVVALVLVCGMGGGAAAQPVVTADPDADLARKHFQHGLVLYNDGRFDAAVREFEAARELKPLPAFDFNIARCYERLEYWERAAAEYERYLLHAPGAPEAAEVRERIPVLRARARRAARTATATAPPTESSARPAAAAATMAAPSSRARSLQIAAWAVGGFAVAAAVAGTGAYLSVYSEYQDQRRQCELRSCTEAELAPLQRDVDRAEAAGFTLWSVAAAAAVADVVLWTLVARERRPARVALVPFGAGVAAVGRF
jgi:tetratricopeptide (TPR) repeat protein